MENSLCSGKCIKYYYEWVCKEMGKPIPKRNMTPAEFKAKYGFGPPKKNQACPEMCDRCPRDCVGMRGYCNDHDCGQH